MTDLELHLSSEPRPKVLVASHERSGTHFLMNTLERCFGYLADPWVDLDFGLGLDFHDPAALDRLFAAVAGKPVRELFKSHHAFGFLAPVLGVWRDELRVLYVYRHPRAVMQSLHRFQRGLARDEGPRAASAGELMRAEPRGAMLRYQKEQAPSVLHRWRRHVEEWLEGGPELGVLPVRYEALDGRFEETVAELGGHLGVTPAAIERPPADRGVVRPSTPRERAAAEAAWSDADEGWLQEVAGPALERFGIG